MYEIDKDGNWIEREPQKFKRSKSGMIIKITFYDSDKPKSLDENPKGIKGLLGDTFEDLMNDEY